MARFPLPNNPIAGKHTKVLLKSTLILVHRCGESTSILDHNSRIPKHYCCSRVVEDSNQSDFRKVYDGDAFGSLLVS